MDISCCRAIIHFYVRTPFLFPVGCPAAPASFPFVGTYASLDSNILYKASAASIFESPDDTASISDNAFIEASPPNPCENDFRNLASCRFWLSSSVDLFRPFQSGLLNLSRVRRYVFRGELLMTLKVLPSVRTIV